MQSINVSTGPGGSCPECGAAAPVETPHGLTCTSCGLVHGPGATYTNLPLFADDGSSKDHGVYFRGVPTLVGLPSERSDRDARLNMLNRHYISFRDKRAPRVQREVAKIAAALGLPRAFAHAAGRYADAALKHVPARTRLASPRAIAATSVYCTARLRHAPVNTRELLAAAGMDRRSFKRRLLALRAALKERAPGMVPRHGDDTATSLAAAPVLLRGMGMATAVPLVPAVHSALSGGLVGMKQSTVAGVVAFVAARVAGHDGNTLAAIAPGIGYQSATLYNAIARTLRKLGFDRPAPLGQFDFSRLVAAPPAFAASGGPRGQ